MVKTACFTPSDNYFVMKKYLEIVGHFSILYAFYQPKIIADLDFPWERGEDYIINFAGKCF